MRHRLETGLTDHATIKRREQTGKNEIGEPAYETVTIAEDVPCQFDSGSTSFVRGDTGERVSRPATATFNSNVDLEEGDDIEIDGHPTTYEVRGINETTDHRRGVTISVEVELERAG